MFVGGVLSVALPTRLITLIAGLAFLGFAAWTLRGDKLDEDEASKAERNNRSAIVAASTAFFLAELGDKTMLATITLATTHSLFWVWLGSTVGMVAADALAIVVGKTARHPPAGEDDPLLRRRRLPRVRHPADHRGRRG